MPPFSSSQSSVLTIHGLATPFPWLSGTFCPFFGEPVHRSGYPWTGGACPWLSGTFCPFFGELVHCSGHPWTGADLLPSLWGLGPVHASIKCWW